LTLEIRRKSEVDPAKNDFRHGLHVERADSFSLAGRQFQLVEQLDCLRVHMRMLKTVNESRKVWDLIETESVRQDVIPCAAAMLTAYSDELVRAMGEGGGSPRAGRLQT
jgi:hypothetical protein